MPINIRKTDYYCGGDCAMDSLKADNGRVDLFQYLVNEDKPNGEQTSEYGNEWYAGSQLEALRYYTDSEHVKILATYREEDYQGKMFAIMKVDDNFVLWRDYFGSCSGCDGLECENGYEYIKQTLSEGNTVQFKSLVDAIAYVKQRADDRYSEWDELPLDLFEKVIANQICGCDGDIQIVG